MRLGISLVISSVKAAAVTLALKFIKAQIYATTWTLRLSKRLKAIQPKFVYLAGVIASLVMVPAQSLDLRLRLAQPVMVMVKCVCSKASSPCSKLALSAAALASTFLSHVKLATAVENTKNKKHLRSKYRQALMMECVSAQWVTVNQVSMVDHPAIFM